MKICLVSNEILGAHLPGGIGTSTSHLALLLARSGHFVTLFYVGDRPLDLKTKWAEYYKLAGVTVRHYSHSKAPISPAWMKMPVETYEQLRDQDFDVVLFQERMAPGHACMVAKRTGLAFHQTTLATITHSNLTWLLEANRMFPSESAHLAVMHMERQQIELSDALVSPSQYLLDWKLRANWTLPSTRDTIPYFLDGLELLGVTPQRDVGQKTISGPKHIVFYGRIERRKGIDIFLSALVSDELKDQAFRLTFLGHPAHRSPDEIKNIISAKRPNLLGAIEFRTDLTSDEAQCFLSERDCVAVIPSLDDNSPCVIYESLKLGLPFIASSGGGIPELIDSNDRERCLFPPTSRDLALKLKEVLTADTWQVPRPAFDQREVARRWLVWFEERAPLVQHPALPTISDSPIDVSVIIAHHERPALVEQSLRALSVQSDRSFKVILVDDGSTSESALRFLERAKNGIGGLPIQIVRQCNKYVGAARNEGVRHAETPFVIFLDDDNIPFPNMIEVFRRAAHSTNADIISCQLQLFDGTEEPDPYLLSSGPRFAFTAGPASLGVIQNCFGDTTAIYRRELFDEIGYFHEIFGVTFEDWQFHLRACLEGRSLLSLPQALFWYRITPNSMIRSTEAYTNARVIAEEVAKRMPANLASLIDLIKGARLEQSF